MPKLWDETIESHRQQVRDAALDATAALVAKKGLRSVTMSQVAETTGIGRATLYKYFPDVETVLLAWHERELTGHLQLLENARDSADSPRQRLEAVLAAYAAITHESHGRHDADVSAMLHRDEHVARGERHLRELVGELVTEAAANGDIRADVAPDELATYALYAIGAARGLSSKAAVRRLVAVTLSGLRRPQ